MQFEIENVIYEPMKPDVTDPEMSLLKIHFPSDFFPSFHWNLNFIPGKSMLSLVHKKVSFNKSILASEIKLLLWLTSGSRSITNFFSLFGHLPVLYTGIHLWHGLHKFFQKFEIVLKA